MPRGVGPRRKKPMAERFWPKVDVRGENECWPWRGAKYLNGYGSFFRGGTGAGRFTGAHRVSYELATGERPSADMVVMHACDNRECVNPAHLSLGTTKDNMRDMVAKGRSSRQLQTHCKNGHEFTPENTFRQSNGSRGCRTCHRRWGRESKERRRLNAAMEAAA